MLVIRCREGESISIGDDVEVTILATASGRVKLGFKAPVEVPVTRRCLEVTRRQNRAAANGIDGTVVDGLASYLMTAEANNVPCTISLQPVAESSLDLPASKENSKVTLHRECRADK